MALHLKEVPEFRCTINLVPSLLAQLEAYVDGATDAHLTLSRRPADGLTHEEACAILDSFFMAFPDTMIRPHPRYHELYMLRSSWNSRARQAPRPLPSARAARPPGLVEPGVDAPPGLRAGPRARRVPRQGEALHRGGEALVAGQAARLAGAGDPPASRAGRRRPGRADDDALLSPDPAPAPGQGPGPRGDAGRLAAVLPRRLPGGRRRARPTRRRQPCRAVRPAPERHVAQRGLGLPGPHPAPGRARHPLDRHRRGDPGLLDAWPGRPRQPGSRPQPRSAVPALAAPRGRLRAGDRVPGSFDVRPGGVPLSAQPRRRSRRPISSARSTPSATPAATTRPRWCR